MEGMETIIDWGGAGVVASDTGGGGAGTNIGVRVGGPAMEVTTSVCKVGGLGLALFSKSLAWAKGEPGGSLGTILGVARDLGPGGLPGPMLPPLGDIFCLDLGLG